MRRERKMIEKRRGREKNTSIYYIEKNTSIYYIEKNTILLDSKRNNLK